MSQTVDSKVVQMKFDNSQFESNVKVSLNTLADLKKALQLDGVSNGLDDISKAAKNVDMSGISSSVEDISLHFDALSVIATTVLANITTSALNTAKSLASSLGSMFVQGGWTRSANIEQAQFQLEGLGLDVDEVMSNALEAVQDTAYGLDEAAKAAAMFGASGIEAGDQMTSSLRAIAGVAAMTGDSYDNIANIFTTVAGNGKLMTIQLRELANRGLNAAATLADYLGVTETEVRDMVSAGEIDFQTFSDAMDDAFGTHAKDANKTFTGALANMKAAMSRFGADLFTPIRDNLRDVFNGVIPVIDSIHEAATPALDGIGDLIGALAGKAQDLFDHFNVTPISNFCEYLGNAIEKLSGIIENFDLISFIEKFKMADETIDNLKTTFKGFIAFLDIVRQGIGFVIKILAELISCLAPVGRGITSVTAKLGEWLIKLDDAIKKNELLVKAADKVIEVLEKFKEKLSGLKEKIANAFDSGPVENFKERLNGIKERIADAFDVTPLDAFRAALERIKERFSPITNAFKKLKDTLKSSFGNVGGGTFFEFLTTLGHTLTEDLVIIIERIGTWFSKFVQMLGNADFRGIIDLLNTVGIAGVWMGLSKVADNLGGITKALKGFVSKPVSIMTQVKECLKGYQRELKAKSLLTIAAAIAVLSGSLIALSLIDSAKLGAATAAMAGLFAELLASTALMGQVNWNKSIKSMASLVTMTAAITKLAKACAIMGELDWQGIAVGLTGVGVMFAYIDAFLYSTKKFDFERAGLFGTAVSLVVLAEAIKMLSKVCATFADMSWNDLAKGLTGVGTLLASVWAFAASLGSMTKTKGSYNLIAVASSIVVLATGIKILESAVLKLSELSWNELSRGLVGAEALLAEVEIFLKSVNSMTKVSAEGVKSYNLIGVASSIVILAGALKILQSAVIQLSGLSWNELAKGLSGVGGLLLEIDVFLQTVGKMQKTNNLIGIASSIVVLAAGIEILQNATIKLAGLSWEEIGKGLTAVGGLLVEIDLFVQTVGKMTKTNNLIGIASSIVILASAIKILQSAVVTFAGLTWEEIAKGLITLAGALGEMAVALMTMSGSAVLKGASAMLVLSTAVLEFAPAMKILASLSWAGLAEGLIAIAGAFTILGVAGYVLGPITGIILGLSAALLLVGVACDLIAASLVMAGAGLTSLSVGLTAFATAITVSGAEIVAGISAIILGIVSLVPEIISGIINGLLSVWDTITNFIKEFILMIIDVVKTTVPALVDGFLEVIYEVCASLAEYAPQIVQSLMILVEGVVDALVDMMPEIIAKLKELVSKIFVAVFEDMDMAGILELITSLTLIVVVVEMLSKMRMSLGTAMTAVVKLGVVIAELALVLAAVGQLTRIPGLEGGIDRAADLLMDLGEAIGSFIGGLVGGIVEGFTDVLPEVAQDLSDFMENLQPFLDGVSQIDSSVAESINCLIGAIVKITGAELLDGITQWLTGGSSIAEFGEELVSFGASFSEYADEIRNVNPDTVTASAAAAESLAEFAKKVPTRGGVWAALAGENSLTGFGKELASFGKEFKRYANSIKGIDPDVVEASAAAAETLSAFANGLPNRGGIFAMFTGENSLAEFGRELASFGRHFKKYAKQIEDIDTGVVEESAAAAETLSTFASELPTSGGLKEFFVGGTTSMDKFGKELTSFGRHFKRYAKAISGIDPESVEATEVAMDVLSELYGTDFNVTRGGIFSIFKDRDAELSDLGAMAESFAWSIGAYAKHMAKSDLVGENIDDVIDATESAVKILEALYSNEITATKNGIFSFLGTHEADLTEMGNMAESFAWSIGVYAKHMAKSYLVGENIDNVLNATDAAVDILDALYSNEITATKNGIFSFITTHEVDLTEMGNMAESFAWSIGAYAKHMAKSELVGENVDDIIDATDAAASILESLYSNEIAATKNGIFSFLGTHEADLTEMGNMAESFALNISIYAQAMANSELSSGDVDDVTDATDVAVSILDTLYSNEISATKSGIFSFLTEHEADLTELGNMADSFATSIGTYAYAMANSELAGGYSDVKKITDATDAAAKILETLCSTEIPYQTGGLFSMLVSHDTSLTEFGKDASGFANSMKDYAAAILDLHQTVGDDETKTVIKATENAAEIITNLCSVEIPYKTGGLLSRFVAHDTTLTEFGADAAAFADNIIQYAEAIEELDTKVGDDGATAAVRATGYAADIMSKLCSVEIPYKTGGLLARLVKHDTTLTEFGADAAAFADNIIQYAEAIEELDTKVGDDGATAAVRATGYAADIMSKLCEVDIPTQTGGLFSRLVTHDTTLTEFGADAAGFADSIIVYSQHIVKLNNYSGDNGNAAVVATTAAAAIMNALCSVDIPYQSSGFFKKLGNHDTTLTEFGDDAKGFADSIIEYARAIVGLNKYDGATDATDTASEIMGKLTNMQLTDVSDWEVDALKRKLPVLAEAIKEYAVNIFGLNINSINTTTPAVQEVVGLCRSISNIEDLGNVSKFADDLTTFGNALSDFCNGDFTKDKISDAIDSINLLKDSLLDFSKTDFSGLSNFSEELQSLASDGVDSFVNAVDGADSQITTAVTSFIDSFINGIESEESSIDKAMKDLIQAMLDEASKKESQFKEAGSSLMIQLLNGITSRSNSLKSAFNTALDFAVTAVRNYYNSFYNAGSYLVSGFANGISDNTFMATARAQAMASAAANAAANELDEHSPSRVGYRIGDFFGIAFVNGIADNVKQAFSVGTDLAQNSISGLQSVISNISNFVDAGLEIQPTITPVLDLSNVKSGMDTVNGMFDNHSQLAFAANNVSLIADSMNRRNIQNDPNLELLKEIKGLNKHMSNLSGDTYNVNGITYDNDSAVSDAVRSLVRAARIGGRA